MMFQFFSDCLNLLKTNFSSVVLFLLCVNGFATCISSSKYTCPDAFIPYIQMSWKSATVHFYPSQITIFKSAHAVEKM
jgi:hypothetical protein